MNIQQIKALDHSYYMNTFGDRTEIAFDHGDGCKLFDTEGNCYTDFFAGIATNALGYNNKGLNAVIVEQLGKLVHTSNVYYNEPQALLAQKLVENSCADRVFFSSTGAEANEGAFKLARKFFYKKGIDRYEIIYANNSFHGRTLATIAATGQDKYQKPYAPLPAGFIRVPYLDAQAAADAVTTHTAAIIVEPIQCEGGVIPGGHDYLAALRKICDDNGILLIFDEVQTGMGRTGKLYASQLYGVEPDIFTSAKALGCGLPISAVLCKEFCSAFEPGDHGTTLGGNALCTRAGLYILTEMLKDGFLEDVTQKGAYLKEKLTALGKNSGIIADVRGEGLILGIQLKDVSVGEIITALRKKGFIAGSAAQNTLRLAPPLIISREEIDAFVSAFSTLI